MTKWRSQAIYIVVMYGYEVAEPVAAFRNKKHAEKRAATLRSQLESDPKWFGAGDKVLGYHVAGTNLYEEQFL